MVVQGTVRGRTIRLKNPLPGLEGRVVRVYLEVIEEEEAKFSEEELKRAWSEWAEGGPQGPIEDDEEEGWP